MDTSHRSRSMITSFAGRVATMTSPDARNLMTLGRRQGWDFAVLGQAPLPDEPVRLGDWLIVPAHQDTSPVPERTLGRVRAVYAAGLRPKGFVVVHEAPRLLPAPSEDTPNSPPMSFLTSKHKSALKLASGVMGAMGLALVTVSGLAILALAALALAAVLLVPVSLLLGAAMVDPILIAVTEDGYWVEIDRWES